MSPLTKEVCYDPHAWQAAEDVFKSTQKEALPYVSFRTRLLRYPRVKLG